MFNAIKQRFHDVRTINAFCSGAEKIANATGQKEPGAEHYAAYVPDLPGCVVTGAIMEEVEARLRAPKAG